MAEGLARTFHGDVLEVVSAGSRPAGWVHPMAMRALAEIGIDARHLVSKTDETFIGQDFDVVVTVCDSAAQDCPTWPGARRVEHWPIDDPSWNGYDSFVATRDELQRRIDGLVSELTHVVGHDDS